MGAGQEQDPQVCVVNVVRLSISERTVAAHLDRSRAKTHAPCQTDLTLQQSLV